MSGRKTLHTTFLSFGEEVRTLLEKIKICNEIVLYIIHIIPATPKLLGYGVQVRMEIAPVFELLRALKRGLRPASHPAHCPRTEAVAMAFSTGRLLIFNEANEAGRQAAAAQPPPAPLPALQLRRQL